MEKKITKQVPVLLGESDVLICKQIWHLHEIFSVSGGSRAAHCGINPTFNAIHGGISQNSRNFLLKRRKLSRGALPPPILTDSFRL